MAGRGHRHGELGHRAKRHVRPGVPVGPGGAPPARPAASPVAGDDPGPADGARVARERLRVALEARRAAAEALAATRASLRRLIESLPGAVVLYDAERRVRFANAAAAAACGRAAEAIAGRLAGELWDAELARETLPALERAFATGEVQRFERARGSGVARTAHEVVHVPLLDARGGARRVVEIATDVSQRRRAAGGERQAAEPLRRTQRLEVIGALAGGVAHDFNNVLAVINGYAENALRELDEQDPLWADMREVLEAGRRGAVLTRQLLAFGRRPLLEPVVLSPNAIVRGLEKMLRRVLGEDVRLEVRLAADCGRVVADPAELEQLVVNLAINARDAARGGPGVVAIETRNVDLDASAAGRHPEARPGPHVVVSVTETGGGPPEAAARLLEQLSPAGPPGEGTGLGLSSARDVARGRGGHLEVEAHAGGTRLSIYLPRTSAEEQPASSEDPALEFSGGHGTIVVVEDDEPLRIVTARTLGRAGYHVISAATGEEALDAARRHAGRIDLLVADVVMPGLSGPEVARRLREAHPEASVLFTSGHVGDPAALHDALVGRANFLAKPYTIGALVRKAWQVVAAARGGAGEGAS